MAINSRHSHTHTTAITRLILSALAFVAGSTSHVLAADSLTYEPSINESLSWDSNPLLLRGNHSALYGSVTAPQFTIRDVSPTTQLQAQFSADENIFNHSNFDSTDGHVSLSLDRKLELWEAQVTEATDYDTTRTSELTTLNINTEGAVRHFGNAITPEISYSPSAVDKISLSASATDSKYDSNLLTDYHTLSVTPSYQYNFTPLSSASFDVQVQRYETDSNFNTKVDSIAPSLQWVSVMTPMLTLKATAGAEDYRQQGDDISDQKWSIQPIFSADIIYKNELDTFDFGGVRSLQPYENGTEIFLNTISLSDVHALNTLFSTNILASYQFAGNSDQAATNLKSLINANVGLTYHMTNTLDLIGSYQYREQTLTNVPGNQDDNLFTLSVAYVPKLAGKT